MSPEYRGEIQNESAALFTSKDQHGFWTGALVCAEDGSFNIGRDGNEIPLGLHASEQKVIEQAENEYDFLVIDTRPPQKPDLAYYLGQIKSWLTFAKWRKG